jgi:plasmid stabilization system protein ParE
MSIRLSHEALPRSGRLVRAGGSLRVSFFRAHRVFFEALPDGIAVKRVLHGARNLDPLLSGAD